MGIEGVTLTEDRSGRTASPRRKTLGTVLTSRSERQPFAGPCESAPPRSATRTWRDRRRRREWRATNTMTGSSSCTRCSPRAGNPRRACSATRSSCLRAIRNYKPACATTLHSSHRSSRKRCNWSRRSATTSGTRYGPPSCGASRSQPARRCSMWGAANRDPAVRPARRRRARSPCAAPSRRVRARHPPLRRHAARPTRSRSRAHAVPGTHEILYTRSRQLADHREQSHGATLQQPASAGDTDREHPQE